MPLKTKKRFIIYKLAFCHPAVVYPPPEGAGIHG